MYPFMEFEKTSVDTSRPSSWKLAHVVSNCQRILWQNTVINAVSKVFVLLSKVVNSEQFNLSQCSEISLQGLCKFYGILHRGMVEVALLTNMFFKSHWPTLIFIVSTLCQWCWGNTKTWRKPKKSGTHLQLSTAFTLGSGNGLRLICILV